MGAFGAELLADETGLVAGELASGTRLKLVSRPNWTAPDGVGVYQVAGLDDESISGFVRSTALVPRDSAAPVVVTVDAAADHHLAERRRLLRHHRPVRAASPRASTGRSG